MEDARHDHVLRAAGIDEDLRHGEGVDDVGDLRPLPAVPAVGAGGEFNGVEDGSHVSPGPFFSFGNRYRIHQGGIEVERKTLPGLKM